MRLIGTLNTEQEAKRFANFLRKEKVQSHFEPQFSDSSEQISYQIWIHEEDQIPESEALFKEFSQNPNDTKFDAPEPEPEPALKTLEEVVEEKPIRRFSVRLTHFLIALCVCVYFLNTLQEISLKKIDETTKAFLLTPIQANLMYDLPPAFANLEELIEKEPSNQRAIQRAVREVETSSYWQGAYHFVLQKVKKESPLEGEGELFIRIRQGEIWRLFSPCIMHKDLLHILFNMLWLWYLGRPIEARIGMGRMLLFTLVAGIFSNTVQYLMSGPFFIGYSGIVTALAGFTWMREKKAPWEGYPLNRATILFLLVFVLAILGLQIVSFCLEAFTTYQFAPNIANSAHIAGALIGIFLGRFSFFAQRIVK